MIEDIERLRWLLEGFGNDPLDPDLAPVARDLADRFTLDQLRAMAPSDAADVLLPFDQLLGRTRPAASLPSINSPIRRDEHLLGDARPQTTSERRMARSRK